MARRDVLDRRLLQVVEQDILSPEAIAYLTERVNDVLRRAHTRHVSARQATDVELRQAEQEAENIKKAVGLGKATATLLEMLEAVEARIRCLRSEVRAQPPAETMALRALPGLVEQYARNLRSVLGRDTECARLLLSRLLGDVVLRPDSRGLVAEVRGNLGAVLEDVPSIGAGSPFSTLATMPPEDCIVA